MRAYIFLPVSLLFALSGCTTPDAVSKFCGVAVTTLSSAKPLFEDMKQSCLREVNSRTSIGTFAPPVTEDKGCEAIGGKSSGAEAAVELLSDYYGAINSLALFGTSKVGGEAGVLAEKSGAAVGVGSPAQTALNSIATFVVNTGVSGYQERKLAKDLSNSSGDIPTVINALIKIIQSDYIDLQLKSEEQKVAIRFQEFAAEDSSGQVKVMLDDRWHADQQAIQARRESARNLIFALQALSKGTSELAANANHLKAKELPALLNPYVTQLQSLVPQVQKGF